MARDNFVYKLIDPRDLIIRWVGITVDVKARYSTHISTYHDPYNPEKIEWVLDLKSQGLLPIMEIVCSHLTRSQAIDKEQSLIHELLAQGVPLLNRDTRRPFSHWTQGDPQAPIVAYKVVSLQSGGFWIVGVIDQEKCLYRFLEDHQVYRSDYHAYPKCKKLNNKLLVSNS